MVMNFKWLMGIAITLLFACNDEHTEYPAQVAPESLLQPILIVAHRGGMAYAPENTVTAIENGLRLNADVVELDVQLQQNEFIALHDFSLDRTTNCSLPSVAADQNIIATCDAGYRWLPGANAFSSGSGWPLFRGAGLRIPTLDDVFNAVSGKDVKLMIDFKHKNGPPGTVSLTEATDRLLGKIQQSELGSSVMVFSSSSFVLARTEAILPETTTILSWGTGLKVPCTTIVLDAISRGFDGVALQVNRAGSAGVDFCARLVRDARMFLVFWTVNSPETVERLLPLRPDAIITDFPACMVALLHGIRISSPYPNIVGGQSLLPKCG